MNYNLYYECTNVYPQPREGLPDISTQMLTGMG